MIASGNFVYTERGILDRTHLRFFTRKSMTQLLESCGFEVTEVAAAPVPLSPLVGRMAHSRIFKLFAALQYRAANLWKNLFAYQLIFTARLARREAQATPGAEESEAQPLAPAGAVAPCQARS